MLPADLDRLAASCYRCRLRGSRTTWCIVSNDQLTAAESQLGKRQSQWASERASSAELVHVELTPYGCEPTRGAAPVPGSKAHVVENEVRRIDSGP